MSVPCHLKVSDWICTVLKIKSKFFNMDYQALHDFSISNVLSSGPLLFHCVTLSKLLRIFVFQYIHLYTYNQRKRIILISWDHCADFTTYNSEKEFSIVICHTVSPGGCYYLTDWLSLFLLDFTNSSSLLGKLLRHHLFRKGSSNFWRSKMKCIPRGLYLLHCGVHVAIVMI